MYNILKHNFKVKNKMDEKYIDLWNIQVKPKIKKTKEWHESMKKIRKSHICYICNKYPGDEEYIFGDWINEKQYLCLDCCLKKN